MKLLIKEKDARLDDKEKNITWLQGILEQQLGIKPQEAKGKWLLIGII